MGIETNSNSESNSGAMKSIWDVIFNIDTVAEAVSGAVGDAISAIILHPVDTVKIRTQADSSVTVSSAVKEIIDEAIEEKNPLAPWRGVEGKLYVSPQQKLQYFYCYSTLLALFRRSHQGRLPSTVEDIFLGYIAALQGTVTSLPLSVTMTRQVVEKNARSFSAIFFDVWEKQGLKGFYNTWASSAILCINPALTFVFYEQMKRLRLIALKLAENSNLSAMDSFLLGAFAKAAATIVTMPLIRSQTLQRTWDKTHKGEKAPGFLEIFPRIIKDDGILGLWTGLETQIFKAVINSALMLMIKERIEKPTRNIVRSLT